MSLTITGLSKTYPNGVQAIKNISLTIGNNMSAIEMLSHLAVMTVQ